jgi:Zn-dependent M28 family amino/carboxypeptidase
MIHMPSANAFRRRSRHIAIALWLTLFVAAGPAAQPASIDAAQLMRDLQTLAADDMEGRLVGTPGSARAREYITRRFKEAGVEPLGRSFEHPFTFGGRESTDRSGVNVLGLARGRHDPSRYIVVTAHYDHLGVRNGQVFNGADDNASGVAVLLAVASQLSANRPEHSVLLAALDAEELGLHGARALVAKPPVPREQLAMNVNMDMVARDAGNVLFASGTAHYPFLKPLLSDVARPPVVLRLGHDRPGAREDDWTRDSDHFPFHEAGIPFVYFGVEDEAQHHKPTDDAETVTREFFVGAANTILAAIRKFDENLEAVDKGRRAKAEGRKNR